MCAIGIYIFKKERKDLNIDLKSICPKMLNKNYKGPLSVEVQLSNSLNINLNFKYKLEKYLKCKGEF